MRDLLKKLQSDPTWSLSQEDQEVSCSHTILNNTNIKIPYEIAEVSENSPESGVVKINFPDLEIETTSSAMKVDNLPLKNVGMELVTNVVSNLTTLKQQGYVSKTGAYYYIDEQLSEDDQFQQVCDEIETRFDI